MRRAEQIVDQFRPGFWRWIFRKRLHHFRLRRQSGQVVIGSTYQLARLRRSIRLQPILLQLAQNKSINLGLRPVSRDFRYRWLFDRLKRPVLFRLFIDRRRFPRNFKVQRLAVFRPRQSVVNPLCQSFNLFWRQLSCRRHLVAIEIDSFQKHAFRRIFKINSRSGFAPFEDRLSSCQIQPTFGLSAGMTLETIRLQDRHDLIFKVLDLCCRGCRFISSDIHRAKSD